MLTMYYRLWIIMHFLNNKYKVCKNRCKNRLIFKPWPQEFRYFMTVYSGMY